MKLWAYNIFYDRQGITILFFDWLTKSFGLLLFKTLTKINYSRKVVLWPSLIFRLPHLPVTAVSHSVTRLAVLITLTEFCHYQHVENHSVAGSRTASESEQDGMNDFAERLMEILYAKITQYSPAQDLGQLITVINLAFASNRSKRYTIDYLSKPASIS